MAGSAPGWQFPAHFRRGQYGWRSSKLAIERLGAAVREIQLRARAEPAVAGDGAVRLVQRLVPAFQDVDSSSGALGNAVNDALEALAALLAGLDVPEAKRAAWLRRLFDAYQDDGYGYLDTLGDLWGRLCATPERASRWADELLPLVRHVAAIRRQGGHDFTKATAACLSALLAAGRHDELLALIDEEPRPSWEERRLGVEALLARGDREAALRYAEASRSPTGYADGAIDRVCEAILQADGRLEEAYRSYGLTAHRRSTYLATFRATAAAYPSVPRERVLADLIAASPGEEGKWFAAARSAGDLALALRLAETSPVAISTLLRAARDHLDGEPAFASGVALAALRWMCAAQFHEIHSGEVREAVELAVAGAMRAAAASGGGAGSEAAERARADVIGRVREMVAEDRSSGGFVRKWAGVG